MGDRAALVQSCAQGTVPSLGESRPSCRHPHHEEPPVARLLAAVKALPSRGPHLYAFFGCMYYAAMRPAEIIHLQKSQCRRPASGWGLLNLKGGVVSAGKEWTDDGAVHEIHSLKRRAAKATSPVPVPPVLVRMLREHIRLFGVASDGCLFRSAAGNCIDASAYGITWGERVRLFSPLTSTPLNWPNVPTTCAMPASRSGRLPASAPQSVHAEQGRASRSSPAATPSSWPKRGTMPTG